MIETLFDFEAAIQYLKDVDWYWVLLFAFLVTMIENIFPPSPSDSVLVFTGTLIPLGTVDFIPLLIIATLGSVVGFIIMFVLGYNFGHRVVESNRIRFINQKSLEKPEEWFRKWGYYLIVANRFLSGTRAVISFFAGMSELSLSKTIILSAVSALVWNSILIYLGYIFADNYQVILGYIEQYGKIIFIVISVAIVLFLIKKFLWDKRKKS